MGKKPDIFWGGKKAGKFLRVGKEPKHLGAETDSGKFLKWEESREILGSRNRAKRRDVADQGLSVLT